MNQTELSERTLLIANASAMQDAMAWIPLIGWTSKTGIAHGFAAEIFGSSPRPADIDKLAKAVRRLQWDGELDVAAFPYPGDERRLGSRPLYADASSYLDIGRARLMKTLEFAVRRPLPD